jgi:glutamate synthase (NADPH/NADH) large chain
MSGGIAYLLDAATGRVNTEMVDLEPLDAEDEQLLATLVQRHATVTGSPVAEALLRDWEASLQRFTKIMPRDYRRVLEATRRAEEAGRDVELEIMEVARG